MERTCTNCQKNNPLEARFCMACGAPLVATRELPPARRVVATGLGALTPVGLDVAESWAALLAGQSGVGPMIRVPNADRYPCNFAGEVRGFEPQNYMGSKEARRLTESSQFAVAAARMAFEDAGLGSAPVDLGRAGVVIGTAIGGGIVESERAMRLLLEGKRISPIAFNAVWPNMAAFAVASAFGFSGYNATLTTACASGTQALGEAAAIIRRGDADVMLAGGTETCNAEVVIAGYTAMGVLSMRRDEPERASRPFDAERDGLVPGEGAAMLVMESLAHAQARGARIYAEVLGYAATSDARHETEPTPETQAQTMRLALAAAGIAPEGVDYVNPHATSTLVGDVMESQAIKLALGEHAYRVPVSATKSMTGHMIGAAGAFEAMACILSMRDGWVHPTINYETPDPACDLDYVPNQARQVQVNVALSNSFGFGGQNACIVLGRWDLEAVPCSPEARCRLDQALAAAWQELTNGIAGRAIE
jgi:3-oxoacyl-[acyl-carrier-protein] synthase II